MSDNQFPIVLAHGIARFDILLEIQRGKFNLPEDSFADRFEYFRRIKTHLEAHGFQVFHPNQEFADAVDVRAGQLRDEINRVLTQTGAAKVSIIAHSMDGLDARRMIVEKAMAERIANLTTVGTPHLGTVLADHVINEGGGFWLIEFLRKVVDLDGFRDLMTEPCREFNERAEADEAANPVAYRTYSSFQGKDNIFFPLALAWKYIYQNEGDNDGLVPIQSQKWTSRLTTADGAQTKTVEQKDFPLPADHLNQIGWWDFEEAVINPFDGVTLLEQRNAYEDKIKQVYVDIAREFQT